MQERISGSLQLGNAHSKPEGSEAGADFPVYSYAEPECHTDADGYFYAEAKPKRHTDTKAKGISDAQGSGNAEADARIWRDATESDGDTYADCYPYPEPECNSDTYTDTECYSYSYTGEHTYSDAKSDSHWHPDAYADTYSNSYSYSDTNAYATHPDEFELWAVVESDDHADRDFGKWSQCANSHQFGDPNIRWDPFG